MDQNPIVPMPTSNYVNNDFGITLPQEGLKEHHHMWHVYAWDSETIPIKFKVQYLNSIWTTHLRTLPALFNRKLPDGAKQEKKKKLEDRTSLISAKDITHAILQRSKAMKNWGHRTPLTSPIIICQKPSWQKTYKLTWKGCTSENFDVMTLETTASTSLSTAGIFLFWYLVPFELICWSAILDGICEIAGSTR